MTKMVSSWFAKAGKDLRLAKAALDFSDDFFEAVAFHGQQCAEKSIKGFLTFHKKSFKKTHDIKELVKVVKSIDAEITKSLQAAKSLTKYAVAYRYPDAVKLEEVTKAKATEVIKIAEKVFKDLSGRMGL